MPSNDSSFGQDNGQASDSPILSESCPKLEPRVGKGFAASDKTPTGHTPLKTIPKIGQKVTICLQGSKYLGKVGVVRKVVEKDGVIACDVKFSDRKDTITYVAVDLQW